MPRRASSLNREDSGISRLIGTQYAVVQEVANHLPDIKRVAEADLEGLLVALQEATDFAGITVVSGEDAGWDPVNKVLTVPTLKGEDGTSVTVTGVTANADGSFNWSFSDGTEYTTPSLKGDKGSPGDKGDKGDDGDPIMIESIHANADYTFTLFFSDGSTYTTPVLRGPTGARGPEGPEGPQGEALLLEQIEYRGNGVFVWHFNDESTYETPSLIGPPGTPGAKGDKGDRGISVHHMKPSNTTEPNGNFGQFGERDTYTFYGDDAETIVLGYFTVMNGISNVSELEALGVMRRATYDMNNNGIVDDSERLGGVTLDDVYAEIQRVVSESGTVFRVSDESEIESLEGLSSEDLVFVAVDNSQWRLLWVVEVDPALVVTEVLNSTAFYRADTDTQLTTEFDTFPKALNKLNENVGTLADLSTTANNSVVAAVNELATELGVVENLTTVAATAVGAINELDAEIGPLSTLTNSAPTVVAAINNSDARVLDLETLVGDSPLNTSADTLTASVNELLAELGDVTQLTVGTTAVTGINILDAEVGDVSTLTTDAKVVVPAINELDAVLDNVLLEVGDVNALTTDAKVVVEAINEVNAAADLLRADVGVVAGLSTTAKEVVSAINELNALKYDKTGGNISGNVDISGNLTVSGDLFVNGTQTQVNTEEVLVTDNLIVINNGEVGNGITKGQAGIQVDRGLELDYFFMFVEASSTFRIGKEGNLQAVATRDDVIADNAIMVWVADDNKMTGKAITDVGGVADTDPRLTDAREWIESTVTLAEAQAGIATARKAWTSEMVRASTVAWWNVASSPYVRTLMPAADSAELRDGLELGNSAVLDVGDTIGTVAAGDDPRIVNADSNAIAYAIVFS